MFRGLNAGPSSIYLNLNNGVWFIDMLKSLRNLMLCTNGCCTDTSIIGVSVYDENCSHKKRSLWWRGVSVY
jgi:hypothetical protein